MAIPVVIDVLVIENPIQPQTAMLIHCHPELRLFDHVPEITEAILISQDNPPHIILLKLKDMTEIADIRNLRLQFQSTPVMVYSPLKEPEFIQAVLAVGAMGFLLGDVPPPDVGANLLTAYQGQVVISTEVIPLLLRS